MMKIDMHVHSCYSCDGVSSPKQLLEKASARGFGFAITEHNNCDSWKKLKELNKQHKVPLIFGEEKKVYSEGKLVGELLFYFLQEEIKPRDFWEAIDEGRKQDAIISVAHPFDSFRKPIYFGFKKLEEVKSKVHAIEVFNSRIYFNALNRRAEKFAVQNNLAFTAGSDSHIPYELGHALTVCKADSLDEFRKCLLKKKTFVEGRLSLPFVHLFSSLKTLGLIKPKMGE